ncbi:MAG: transposase [Candidatus Aminicenantes bacterium]|nr:transposase [Candidatus Aminicenantes bacterium]
MPRIARIVVPEMPHHITQRGNRRQKVFFSNRDKQYYLKLLKTYAKEKGVKFWAFSLMENHVHFIAVPKYKDSFAKGFGEAHRRYSRMVNLRENWRGYLWQGRFDSYPMEDVHLFYAIRYVERNPVRAGIVKLAEDYHWSSANAHVKGEEHALLETNYYIQGIPDWKKYLEEPTKKELLKCFRQHSRTGRPMGGVDYIEKLEEITGRNLKKLKPGPKKK